MWKTRLQYKTVAYKFVPNYANPYNHTILKATVFVRSPKLSKIGTGEYLDGWPLRNTRCCRLFLLSVQTTENNYSWYLHLLEPQKTSVIEKVKAHWALIIFWKLIKNLSKMVRWVRFFIFYPQLWKVCNLPATNAPTRTKNLQFGDRNNVRWSIKTSPLFSNLSSAKDNVEPACKHEPTRYKIDDLVTNKMFGNGKWQASSSADSFVQIVNNLSKMVRWDRLFIFYSKHYGSCVTCS